MGVRITTNIPSIIKQLDNYKSRIDEEMVASLVSAGNTIVNMAKDTHTYKNRSGNLEASTGFGVVVRGQLVEYGGFDSSFIGGNVGVEKLKSIIDEAKEEYSIIIVAGMEYATYVERSGYVVLDNARYDGESVLKELLDKINIEI